MTLVTVRVDKPRNWLVYINRGYSEPTGSSSADGFTVSTGGQVFETPSARRCIDNRKKLRVRPALLANDPGFARLLQITGAPGPSLPRPEDVCAAFPKE